ncbi:aspartate carbamoyltransferase catalytic subunit [Desulfovibrio aerotolerans]|uniref:Aspartate carbamoyltransferase n=1 Tax=Solidesulfovibrio aerotolerans TaxID=295255 RepID=A0A7C9IMY5_9BACT|nr:aspartate carbamoyltransferase catalytic subunit [Solidesulfovibrio aerotolerans]MYL82779.1 aspartate carbamoyltransferase catalytic subunit [Solidesulfovibrio aerotolerans]
MNWPHKDLLDVSQLSREDVDVVMRTAASFREINSRPVKKVPTLKGKSVVLFFAEPSTRTKTSFDIAGKRLSADTFGLAKTGSSLQKGETLKDTVLTLQAMNPDAIVMRHSASGAADFVARRVSCAVINAGDGWHAHPTQALLDLFTLRGVWGDDIVGKTVVILGDVAHSRVARSNVRLLTMLGATVRLCAPRTLLPKDAKALGARVYHELEPALDGADAVMCLRLQLERQEAGLLPELREYARRFCLTKDRLALASPDVKVMHPGPINRGVEIASDLADAGNSLILDQVASGVAVRMALLYLHITRKEEGGAA